MLGPDAVRPLNLVFMKKTAPPSRSLTPKRKDGTLSSNTAGTRRGRSRSPARGSGTPKRGQQAINPSMYPKLETRPGARSPVRSSRPNPSKPTEGVPSLAEAGRRSKALAEEALAEAGRRSKTPQRGPNPSKPTEGVVSSRAAGKSLSKAGALAEAGRRSKTPQRGPKLTKLMAAKAEK